MRPSTGGNFNRYWYANNNPYRFTDPDGRQVFCNGSRICPPEKSSFSMIGPRLTKAVKLDIGVGPGLSAGFKLTNNLKVQAGGRAVIGISVGGQSGIEGFAEREASVGAKVGPAEASLGIDKVRAGADPKVLRESTNKFGIDGGRVSTGAETDRTVSIEATVMAVYVKVAVDVASLMIA